MSALARTEKDIEDLLSNDSVSNEEKLTTYMKLSEKFDKLRTIKNVLPIAPAMAAQPNAEPAPNQPKAVGAAAQDAPAAAAPLMVPAANLDHRPLPSFKDCKIPAQFHNKFSLLKNIISTRPDLISVSDTGEVVLSGVPVAHSSFNELFRELYVSSSFHNKLGQNQLLQIFHDINVNPTYLSNKLVVNKYNRIHKLKPNPLTQYASGPPAGKRPRTQIIYKK